MSNTTKYAFAAALKERLTRQRLDEITIQNLADDVKVSRKTFYYHFQDIYALLEWILLDEATRLLDDSRAAARWQQDVRNIFDYVQRNKNMILNLYRSLEEKEALLEIHISRLVRPMMERIFNAQPGQERVSQGDRQFILDLYSFGLVELFLRWIGNGMKPEGHILADQIERIVGGCMGGMIQRCNDTAGMSGTLNFTLDKYTKSY